MRGWFYTSGWKFRPEAIPRPVGCCPYAGETDRGCATSPFALIRLIPPQPDSGQGAAVVH